MARAIALTERGRDTATPNPSVGCVLVKRGRIIGEGWHERAGEPHAETKALAAATESADGATVYVSLEPCSHHGRTPPCADALVAARVGRVVAALEDPNPRVKGQGAARLREAGIRVDVGLMADAASEAHRGFIARMSRGRPWMRIKAAVSLDGRIALANGESRWITGEAARRRGLLLREEYDAVLVGAGTVVADDPLLTRRLGKNRTTPHWRIVLDGRLRIPERARVLRGPGRRLVATAVSAEHPKARRLAARGIEVWSLPARKPGIVNLERLLRELARAGVASVMVEGGAETLWSFFHAGLVDRVAAFLAPRVMGGDRAPGGVGGKGFSLAETPHLRDVAAERIGADLFVTGRVT